MGLACQVWRDALMVGSSPSQQVLDSIWVALSDFSLLGHFKSVIDLDAQISDSTFNLGMPEQQLHCPQIFGAPVNQTGLGPAHGVRAVRSGIKTNFIDPRIDDACILTS
jgi:hypothetical protein